VGEVSDMAEKGVGGGPAIGGEREAEWPADPSGPSAEAGAAEVSAHRHHWIRTPLLIGIAAVVVIAGVVVVSYVLRTRPGPKSLSASTRQFRSTTTTSPTVRRFELPAAGVYKVTGQGSERISKPPNSQADGPLMPVGVTYLADGCWRWRINYNTASWQEYDFCPQGSQLLLVAQSNYQAWNFGLTSVTNLGQYTCNPPSPIVVQSPMRGQRFTQRCTGTNTAVPGLSVAAGTVTVVGVQTLSIGRTSVRAVEMTRHQTISGAQHGTLDESWWFATSTGLPLKAVRNYRLVTSSVIGDITYNESGSWQLDSLTSHT
jgi:hypothetical protein